MIASSSKGRDSPQTQEPQQLPNRRPCFGSIGSSRRGTYRVYPNTCERGRKDLSTCQQSLRTRNDLCSRAHAFLWCGRVLFGAGLHHEVMRCGAHTSKRPKPPACRDVSTTSWELPMTNMGSANVGIGIQQNLCSRHRNLILILDM